MPIYTLKLIDRYDAAQDTPVFIFEKRAAFTYKPGQYGGFTLINPAETDAGGITRRFSLLSSPDDAHLAIVTRVQNSAFKRVLNSLLLGNTIKFAGPSGNFTLHDDVTVPAVFIAGGIGIAPFYSMIRYHLAHPSPQKLYLFYGNQHIGCAPFLQELLRLQHEHPLFHFIPTMDRADPTWSGETGFIDNHLIKKYVEEIDEANFYVCGSPVMVTALQETLLEMDIDEARIKVEDFPGY